MVGITALTGNLPVLGGLGKMRSGQGAKSRLTLDATADFLNFTGGSITAVANAWTRIGSYTVGPQRVLKPGFGRGGQPNAVVGAFYATLTDDTGGVATYGTGVRSGQLRLSVQDSDGRVRGYSIINQTSIQAVNTSYANKDTRMEFPEQNIVAREDDQIILEYNPGATAKNLNGGAEPTWLDYKIDMTLIS